jgi:hypothetical protein
VKNLAGAPTLPQGFEGYTRGCTSAPPQNSIATRRDERPISKHQPLCFPDGYHRRGSGATVRDSHKGPLITGENPFSQIIKTQANSRIVNCTHAITAWRQEPTALETSAAEGPIRRPERGK